MATTVLLVEDEPRVLELYALWLETDYDVRTASSGEAALAAMDGTVDVVLLDRRLPDMSGTDVLRQFRQNGYDGWVVMVTAVEPDEDVIDLGFDDYLVKPIERAELHEAVEVVLRRQEYDDALRTYFRVMAKIGILESAVSAADLANSDEYERLRVQLRDAKQVLRNTSDAVTDSETLDDIMLEAPADSTLEGF